MFSIYDGREYFWQWDLNQRLIVNDVECCEVHFCNKTDDCSLVCEIYEEDDLRIVNVPNILLQTDRAITAFVYVRNEDESYTRQAKIFMVRPRTKPEEYVYTETEVLSYRTLDERLTALEGEGIARAVEDYLIKNPIDGSLPVVTAADENKVLTVVGGSWVAKSLPVYEGEYSVTPAVTEQTLATAQSYMDADIKVEKIPYSEVSNISGGKTATIGGN